MAWVVSVKLAVVARHLTHLRGRFVDELDALQELTGPWKGEPSPLRQTRGWGLFYTDVDPAPLLETAWIEYSNWIPRTKNWRFITHENTKDSAG